MKYDKDAASVPEIQGEQMPVSGDTWDETADGWKYDTVDLDNLGGGYRGLGISFSGITACLPILILRSFPRRISKALRRLREPYMMNVSG